MRIVFKKKYRPDYDAAGFLGAIIFIIWAFIGLGTSLTKIGHVVHLNPSFLLISWLCVIAFIIGYAIYSLIYKAITDIFDIDIEKD